MEHVVMKLVTSELIIGRLEAETEKEYLVSYPMIVDVRYHPTTFDPLMYLTPFNPFGYGNQSDYLIDKKHVVTEMAVYEEVIEFYERSVSKKSAPMKDTEYEAFKSLLDFMGTSNTSIN
jgi:hypothetical protein